ncbi:unnamed protein product, partial [Caenorhabditis brenneri]
MVLILVDFIDPQRLDSVAVDVLEVGRPFTSNTEQESLPLNGPKTVKYLVSLVDVIIQMMKITFNLKGKEYRK